mgnify:CR=1 FL=1
MSDEKGAMKKDVKRADEQARQAWRGWVIPAVGSMAFFSSMLINGVKNYQTYGFPTHVFNRSDWILLSLPFIVVGVALSDMMPKSTGE